MSGTAGMTVAVGGAIGLGLAIFGVRMLSTGRAPAPTTRAFRTVRDAGCYHLFFGVALLLVVVSTTLRAGPAALVSNLIAVLLVAVAVARFRPRGRRSADQK